MGIDTSESHFVVEGKISGEFADNIKQSTISIFTTICQEVPQFLGIRENGVHDEVVVGIMSMVSKEFTFSLVLGFYKETALAVALKFARIEIPFDGPDMSDVVGELSNILTGDISARLENIGVKGDLAIPAVARGKEIELTLPTKSPALCLLFKLSCGTFWVKVAIGKPEQKK